MENKFAYIIKRSTGDCYGDYGVTCDEALAKSMCKSFNQAAQDYIKKYNESLDEISKWEEWIYNEYTEEEACAMNDDEFARTIAEHFDLDLGYVKGIFEIQDNFMDMDASYYYTKIPLFD